MRFSSATSSRAHRQPADMRAIGFKEYGGPEVLQEWTCPPKPSVAGRVRVRVTAAAVPIRPTPSGGAGLNSTTGHPEDGVNVPGLDVARGRERGRPGRVDRRGGRRPGHGQSHPLEDPRRRSGRTSFGAPAPRVLAVPAGASDVEAATLPMNGLTVLQASAPGWPSTRDGCWP